MSQNPEQPKKQNSVIAWFMRLKGWQKALTIFIVVIVVIAVIQAAFGGGSNTSTSTLPSYTPPTVQSIEPETPTTEPETPSPSVTEPVEGPDPDTAAQVCADAGETQLKNTYPGSKVKTHFTDQVYNEYQGDNVRLVHVSGSVDGTPVIIMCNVSGVGRNYTDLHVDSINIKS